MGILKHFVLPVLAVGHAFQVYKLVVDGKEELPKSYGWPGSDAPMSPRELHMMGIILSTSITLFVNCTFGIFLENAHYRGMATLLEFIFFAAEAYDAHITGFPIIVKLGFGTIALVGLVVHAMEPGIFTKDKNASKKSK
jgi:hypothetical protein